MPNVEQPERKRKKKVSELSAYENKSETTALVPSVREKRNYIFPENTLTLK